MVGTDTSDGRHYVENAAGAENLQQGGGVRSQRLGGNVELRGLDPSGFRLFGAMGGVRPGDPDK
ncbi:MAG: hypothetical protein ACRDVN_15835 [Jiangellaceae bacterium]